jgi:hypothetical protein
MRDLLQLFNVVTTGKICKRPELAARILPNIVKNSAILPGNCQLQLSLAKLMADFVISRAAPIAILQQQTCHYVQTTFAQMVCCLFRALSRLLKERHRQRQLPRARPYYPTPMSHRLYQRRQQCRCLQN